MAGSNLVQVSFLGGEWSKFAQGRTDKPDYHTAMRVCQNGLPLEEGCWVRRPGTQRLLPTYQRLPAKLLRFLSSTTCSFAIEATTDGSNGWVRFLSGVLPIFTNDPRTISTATYDGTALTLGLDATHGWSIGDQFLLSFPTGYSGALESGCRGRVMAAVSGTSGSTLKLEDDQGNPLVIPALPGSGLVGATVLRILRINAPWLAIPKLRLVQAETDGIVLSSLKPPQTIEVVEPTGSNDPTFTLAATAFVDGPYMVDPQPDAGTVSGFSGSITFTPSVSSTFTASDVGRMIRLFTEPAAWNGAHTYANGELATYNNQWWISIAAGAYATSNVGIPPGTSLTTASGTQAAVWAPAPTAGRWAWGTITAQATTSCTVSLVTTLPSVNGVTVTTWFLGLLKAGQYPICGTYHAGRLWLSGAVQNQFDASMSNDLFTFSPTDIYGNVNDNNAISYKLNSKTLNNILWMQPDAQGILCGTLGSEWLITASTLNDPITPTSIDAREVTPYGSLEHEPLRAGPSLIFVQRYGRKLYEYLSDTFSGKFSGKPINEFSKHLTKKGVAEIAYQDESTPVIWTRTNDGQLIGCTYRRISRFVNEDPVFKGWHGHVHGEPNTTFNSMCVVPAEDGLDDRLYVNAIDGLGQGWIEMLRPLPEVDDGEL